MYDPPVGHVDDAVRLHDESTTRVPRPPVNELKGSKQRSNYDDG